jgi:hypothetical protein
MFVVGSMTRSGFITTHPHAAARTRRITAARPAQPASKRSIHAPGLMPLPNESPFTAALSAIT